IRRKHSKKGELDYQILITIANNGAQSVTGLKENIGRAKSTISKKLKKMGNLGSKKPVITRVVSQSPTKKTRDKYFVLTKRGIEKLILGEYGEKISSKTFWKMMYYSFHKTSEQKMNTKLDYFLSLYAENILGFSTDYVQIYPVMNYELSDYYEKKHLGLDNKLGKAFDFIAYEKSVSKQRLEKIFGKEILSLFFKKRETEGRQLFTPIQLNQSRIELTIFGLLLLLRRLYDQARNKKLTEREVQNKKNRFP
ncbi:hypothetical protein IH879_02940, partial [candidate division KSB1 bacterium]|nr:hypothetical protein [candidate division KSB1 bacterium]